MIPQANIITLGVRKVDRAKKFYASGLGCRVLADHGEFVSLELGDGSSTLALYRWEALAADAGVSPDSSGFRAFTLSHILDRPEQVDAVMANVKETGAQIGKPARGAIWGGYSGYFTDPDGYLWKVGANKRPPLLGSREGGPRQAAIAIKPKETAVTLGVKDFKRVKEFYANGLGCPVDKSFGSFARFKLGGSSSTLGLYRREALAKDAGVSAAGQGFRGFTLSHIVSSSQEVDELLLQAASAGGTIAKQPQAQSWGGYSGYFTDPDSNLWKVAAGA